MASGASALLLYIRIFRTYIAFRFLESQFNDRARSSASVRVTKQCDLYVLPLKTEQCFRPVARNARELEDKCKLHPQPFVLHAHLYRCPERPEQLELVFSAHDGFRFLSCLEPKFLYEALLHLRPGQHDEPATIAGLDSLLPIAF